MLKQYLSKFLIIPILVIMTALSGCLIDFNFPRPTTTPQSTQRPVEGKRDRYTKILGGGNDTVTIMIYMCGSDLESKYGLASNDLLEIQNSFISDKVNVIIETGGAKEWKNELISNTTNERYIVRDNAYYILDDTLGKKDMTDPNTLTDFIKFCTTNYKANRNILILWDHGGGSLSGYGYDEIFDSVNPDSMSIDEIDLALKNANTKFDFIGFDACLMGTVETAFVLEKYSDYMLASQKKEPGTGWYYTDWITAISKNTSISTEVIGKKIIDDYVDISSQLNYTTETTLSLIELMQIEDLFSTLSDFFLSAGELLNTGKFVDISKARAITGEKAFTEDYDHVDLSYLAENMNIELSDDVINQLNRCVVYFSGKNTNNTSGLAIYFPYTQLEYFNVMRQIYLNIGISREYIYFLQSFITLMIGGQTAVNGNPISGGDESDLEQWEDYEWFDSTLIDEYDEYYDEYSYDYDELKVTEKNGYYVLQLTEESWDIVTKVELQVYLDDGNGFIYLGSDSRYEFDEDGDLIIQFDNKWVAVNDQIVAFYTEEEVINNDGSWYTYGAVPIYLNDEPVDLMLMWDNKNPNGYVLGVRMIYEGAISQKGYAPLYIGDIVDFVCDKYTYEGEYDNEYYFNERIEITGEPVISYQDIGLGDCYVYYMIQDIYGNNYWTEPVLFHD